MSALTLKANERVFAVGKTGSGKTYLMRRLTGPLKRLVVVDPKGTLGDDFATETWNRKGVRELMSGNPARLRFPAPISENPESVYEELFEQLYYAGDLVVYIDEAYGVVENTKGGKWLRALYTRGRELGIGVWACSQRPAWVPLFMASEADWLFVFRLQMETDRKRMSEIMGHHVLNQIRDTHGFYFMHTSWDTPRYVRQLR
jgi:energy-coupling factor transporter ATP-binding protein EcfA2